MLIIDCATTLNVLVIGGFTLCNWVVPTCLKLIGCTLVAKGVPIREFVCTRIANRASNTDNQEPKRVNFEHVNKLEGRKQCKIKSLISQALGHKLHEQATRQAGAAQVHTRVVVRMVYTGQSVVAQQSYPWALT